MSPNNTHITDDLLVKYLLLESTAEESKAVESWINESGSNRKYFDDFKTIWDQSKILAATSEVDEEKAWQRFRNRVSQQPTASPVIEMSRNMKWIRVAAIFLVMSGLGWFSYQLFSKDTRQMSLASLNGVITDTLPDGSVITLNKNSSLEFPENFKGKKRSVTLKGEAFFNVAANKNKPFEITVNDILVRVVGTSFNIRSENGSTEVIVETGIVQVIRADKMVELRPGQKLVVDQVDQNLVPQNEEEQLYNYYRSKEFVCDNTPLWKLVETLNEAYQVNIIIERPELKTLPLDVTFSNESLDVILDIIKETFNTYHIKIEKTSNTIILK
ncbi:MAG TPA: FecR domain-containing protein [Flavisolibacter sp.]